MGWGWSSSGQRPYTSGTAVAEQTGQDRTKEDYQIEGSGSCRVVTQPHSRACSNLIMVGVCTLALLKKKSSSLSQPWALLLFDDEAPLGAGFVPPVAYRDFGTFGAQARLPFLSAPGFFCSSLRFSHA